MTVRQMLTPSEELFRSEYQSGASPEYPLSELEFIDTGLEGLRVELKELFVRPAKFICHYTFSAGPVRQEIPSEWLYSEPEHFENSSNDLNSIADIF